jgi:integrase
MPRRRRTHGEGSITERPDGKYQAQIRLSTGKRPSRTFATKREASAWLAETRTKDQQGMLPANDRETLGEYLARWWTAHAPTLRPGSRRVYEHHIEKHIRPALGHHALARLRPDHLAAFYAALQAAGVGAPTIRHCHAYLHLALRQAVDWGLIPRNVADLIRPPRHQARQPAALTPEQAAGLLRAIAANERAGFYALLLLGGLRRGEALAARWSDIDWRNGTVRVTRQLVYVAKHGGLMFTEPKSATGRRVVPLPPAALAILKERRDRQAFHRARVGDAWRDHDLITSNQIGGPLHPDDARRAWGALRVSLGLTATRLHDLRHTYASLLLEAGVSAKVVQERLGHSSIGMTLGTYTHTSPTLHADATARLERLISTDWQRNGSNEPPAAAERA